MASHTNYSASSKTAYEMVSEIMIDIEEEAEDLKTSKHNIYRVPCIFRNLNKEAYTPQLISIGPLHYGQEQLAPMQQQKLQYLRYFWDRVNGKAAIEGYKNYLASHEEDIRHCYEVKFPHITKEKFVDVMLFDGVFIMELLLRDQAENKSELYKDDSILKQTWLNNSIKRDLLLLENQIPFFILEKLYEYVPDKKHQKFTELAANYFDCFYPYKSNPSSRFELFKNLKIEPIHFTNLIRYKKLYVIPDIDDNRDRFNEADHDHLKHFLPPGSNSSSCSKLPEEKELIHFTDLIRHTYLWKDQTQHEKRSSCFPLMTEMKIIKEEGRTDTCKEGLPNLMTATKLKEAGVSFEKVIHKPLVDIKFKKVSFLSWFLCLGCLPKFTYFKNRLQIPQLKVDDTTECVFRNLIAFEQCHYADQPYICNYVSFIDSLIHTKDDVELLVKKQVIIHELGSDEEVSTLVNGLCKQVVTNQTCYRKVIDGLDKHYQNSWNHSMAALRLVYFRDAWRASSTLVGIAVLMFTLYNFFQEVLRIKTH